MFKRSTAPSIADVSRDAVSHAPADAPASNASASDELADDDLDEVVGGLARAWSEHALARLIHG
jgi:hypothetical protein